MVRRRTTNDERRTWRLIRWSLVVGRWSFVLGLALLLSGCLLVSGERSSSDSQPAGGNFTTSFVGADGQDERTIDTGAAGATLRVFVIVKVERGELRVEMLNPDGAVVFATQARPDQSTTRTASVVTDDQGQLHYRVTTRGARNGGYQVLYQRTGQ